MFPRIQTSSWQPVSCPQAAIRITIADNQTLYREGLRELLRLEPGFQVVGATGDSSEVLKLLRSTKTDILLSELKRPNLDGHAILRQLRSTAIPARTIVLTGCDDPEELIEALELGARGIVMKQSAIDQLTEAIRTVYQGKVWLDPYFMQVVFRGSIGPHLMDGGAAIGAWRFWNRLTARERDIVFLSLQGYRSKDIAAKLSISAGTVRIHLHHVYTKLRASDRREIAAYGVYAMLQAEASASRREVTPRLSHAA